MRIISGKYRHRLISWPDSEKTRPTKDCVREAVFNALREDIEGATVLDLFAGSGSLGIEALSWGAKRAVFVDDDKLAITVLKDNLRKLNIEEEYQVIFSDYLLALNNCKESFDMIFLDPPYAFDDYYGLINYLIRKKILKDTGIIVLETDRQLNIDESVFAKVKHYKYGKTYITIMRR